MMYHERWAAVLRADKPPDSQIAPCIERFEFGRCLTPSWYTILLHVADLSKAKHGLLFHACIYQDTPPHQHIQEQRHTRHTCSMGVNISYALTRRVGVTKSFTWPKLFLFPAPHYHSPRFACPAQRHCRTALLSVHP